MRWIDKMTGFFLGGDGCGNWVVKWWWYAVAIVVVLDRLARVAG
jgi:hypothetical protein